LLSVKNKGYHFGFKSKIKKHRKRLKGIKKTHTVEMKRKGYPFSASRGENAYKKYF